MSFETIYGQKQAKRILQNSLRNGTLSHAYIFSGPVGTGRKKMAYTLIKAALCRERTDDCCDRCLECRKVEHGNHPDVHWIEPEGNSIKIEQIRSLQKNLAYRSKQAGLKFYILNEADRMTIQAANSLLKLLEEPNSGIVAILITENGQALLPTIRSRAQWISFVPMAPEEMIPVLLAEGHAEELVRSAVHLAAGLDAARELIQANWFAEIRNVMIQLAKESQDSLPSALLTVQNKIMKSEAANNLPAMLDLWLLWYRDLLYLSAGREDRVVFTDELDWLKKHAFIRGKSEWIFCMERIVELQKRLRFHVNAQLGLEHLVIQLQKACL